MLVFVIKKEIPRSVNVNNQIYKSTYLFKHYCDDIAKNKCIVYTVYMYIRVK